MRPRISITGSVRPSVRPSVRRSVRRSVGHAFVKNEENRHFGPYKCPSNEKVARGRIIERSVLFFYPRLWPTYSVDGKSVTATIMTPTHLKLVHARMDNTHTTPLAPTPTHPFS